MSETNQDNSQEHGSFSSGIVVGFLAGAVGYFLAKTKEGEEIREKFSDHWHSFRSNLIEEGKLSEAESEITDYINAARTKIGDFLGECFDDQPSKKKIAKKKSKSKKKVFKGI